MPNPSNLTPALLKRIVEDRKVRRNVARESHQMFFSIYLPHYAKFETAPFQREFFALTEDEKTKMTVLVAFRGSGKSTIMTLSYPIWAITGKLQKKFILLLSETQQQARQYLINIREELESNKVLRDDLGPFKQQEDEWGNATLVIDRYGARITAASTEQSVRGIRHGSHRPDLIIADDVEDTNSAKTREGREKVYNWLTGEILPAGDTQTKVLVIGNLLHEDCLPMRLRRDIKLGKRQGIYREFPLVTDDGQITWPGQFPDMAAIEAYRLVVGNEVAWQREYMLKIVADENQLIPHDWIKHYDRLPEPTQPDAKLREVVIGVDLAISQRDTADYTAMVVARVHGRSDKVRVYILPQPVNARLTHLRTLNRAEELAKAHEAGGLRPKFYVEEVGYQGSVVEQLKNRNLRAEGTKVHGQDKRARLGSVSHLVEAGKVLFPERGAENLISQLTGFGTERHDDLADAFAIVLHRVVEMDKQSGGRVWFGTHGLRSHIFKDLDDLGPEPDDGVRWPYTRGLMNKRF